MNNEPSAFRYIEDPVMLEPETPLEVPAVNSEELAVVVPSPPRSSLRSSKVLVTPA